MMVVVLRRLNMVCCRDLVAVSTAGQPSTISGLPGILCSVGYDRQWQDRRRKRPWLPWVTLLDAKLHRER